MTKNEVIDLLESIDNCYPGKLRWEKPQELIAEWTEKLQKYDAQMIQQNFLLHVEQYYRLPTIADLVRKPATGKVVPSLQETRDFLNRYESTPATDEEVIRAEQEKIKKMLGIDRGSL